MSASDDLSPIVKEINYRIAAADAEGNATKSRDHRISTGLRLIEARRSFRQRDWPRWLRENIQFPPDVVQACLGLVEHRGTEVYLPEPPAARIAWPLYLMHEPSGPHLRTVINDMVRLGNPEIMCVWTPQGLYALEGVHRLTACSMQFLQCGATLICLANGHMLTADEWNRLCESGTDWISHARCNVETAGGLIEFLRTGYGAWGNQYKTYRRDEPGTYRSVVFRASSPWNLGIKKRDLPTLTAGDRMRMKRDWQPDPDIPGKYRISAGHWTATVFPAGAGWKIWINKSGTGTRVYETPRDAQVAAVAAVGRQEAAQSHHRDINQ
jgi:hypothetical protein